MYKTRHDWMGKLINWEVCKKFRFDLINKWWVHKLECVLENKLHSFFWFWDANRSSNLGQTSRPCDSQPKRELYRIVDFTVPAHYRRKLIESEKRDNYRGSWYKKSEKKTRNKLGNMKVTVITNLIGVLGIITKVLLQGLEDLEMRGQVEIIQTKNCWDRPGY